ncbi:MAG: hypothetical protein ACE37M_03405 [Henriciella sp.]
MKTFLTTLALLAAPLASPVAVAQSDGTLGSSSTGTLNFNVKISNENRIAIRSLHNLTQTVELGHFVHDRGLGALDFPINDSGQFAGLCVEMAEAGPYTLDWSATPLESATMTEPYHISFYRRAGPVVTGQGTGRTLVDQPSSGSILNLSSGPTPCNRSGSLGRIGMRIEHPVDSLKQLGQYVATITLTVSPD